MPPHGHRAPYSALPLSSAIAKQSCGRPGEAAHPGPRARVPLSRVTGLEEQPLLSQATLQLGTRCWESFLVWSASRLSCDLSETFGRSPALLAMALRAYANWLYRSGGKLHNLRHTLLASQRKYMGLKPFSGMVWELITRWEHAEPSKHRTPIPEPIVIVSLAWSLGFFSFAGVTLLAFYVLGRMSEDLRTSRRIFYFPGMTCGTALGMPYERETLGAAPQDFFPYSGGPH